MKRTTKLLFKINERNSKETHGGSTTFEYSSPDEMLDFDDPASDAALIKACIELVGIRDFSKTVSAQRAWSREKYESVRFINSLNL